MEPDYLGIAWKWVSDTLGELMTDQWNPKTSDDSRGVVIVSGNIIDRTGENRTFSVIMSREGIVDSERSLVSPKQLTKV